MSEIYLPNEIWEKIIMKNTINDILKMRLLSKEMKNIIDNLWSRLLDRDYGMEILVDNLQSRLLDSDYGMGMKHDCYDVYKYRLLDRDYGMEMNNDCYDVYKYRYLKPKITIKKDKIEEAINKYIKNDKKEYTEIIYNILFSACFFINVGGDFIFDFEDVMASACVLKMDDEPFETGRFLDIFQTLEKEIPDDFIILSNTCIDGESNCNGNRSWCTYDIGTVNDVINDLLSYPFECIISYHINMQTCYDIVISLKNYKNMFNYFYGKDSFDKEFLKYAGMYIRGEIYTDRDTYIEYLSPEQMLEIINSLANYEGKNINEYRRILYNKYY